jgi:raffinose synthase
MLICFPHLIWCGNESGNKVTWKSDGKKIDIFSHGKARLCGGQIEFHSKPLEIKKLVRSANGFYYETGNNPINVTVKKSSGSAVLSLFISPNGNESENGKDYVGFFFEKIPEFSQGMTIWRYKPWNSWSKPIRINDTNEMEDWDVQFFYWKYTDGLYGAAMPISGQGYRTTIGRSGSMFGAKAVSYSDNLKRNRIPLMAVAFGNDPYELFARLYREGLSAIGKNGDFIANKKFPKILEKIGWCTWNSSNMGQNLNEEFLIKAAKSFKDFNFPIGYFIIDDGWFDHTENRLNSFKPEKTKFPNGFKQVIQKLKSEYNLSDVGIWHAFNGYWQGINPESELGKKYGNDLFSWKEKINPELQDSPMRTCWFISPYSKSLYNFYDEFHRSLKDQGFSFLKVDNQLSTERMCAGNFPIWDGAEKFHKALYKSISAKFGNTVINCMDMTPDAYLNFGKTSVARAVEDYFPFEKGETYNLQKGNAAAHVIQAIYNSIYFSQMVFPDFDLFQSHNPNGIFHAVARAINNGPVYLTDNIGQQKFDLLFPLIYSDGRIIRPDKPLLPAVDCLFQLQDSKPFKAFSMSGDAGLLGIWNCADTNKVEGSFKPTDVRGIKGEKFAVYEYFSKSLFYADRNREIPITLNRLGCKLYYIIPVMKGNAVIGLINKYNAPGTVLRKSIGSSKISAILYEGGSFAAVVKNRPVSVKVDGKETQFEINGHLLNVEIPLTVKGKRNIEIVF